MGDTNNSKVSLGQSAHFMEKEEIHDSAEVQADKASPSIKVVYRSTQTNSSAGTFYVRVNFDSVKKKDVYKKINRILGES